MRLVVGRDWSGLGAATELQSDPTPPAKTQFLVSADRWPLDAAINPYAGCAHLYRGGEANLERRYFSLPVAPGANHARYHVAIGFDGTAGTAASVSAATEQGGLAGNNPTKLYQPTGYARNFDPAVMTQRVNMLSSEYIADVPGSNLDRQLELEQLAHPKIEAGFVEYACGHSFVVSRQVENLEAL